MATKKHAAKGPEKVTSAKVATKSAKQLASKATPKVYKSGLASAVAQAAGTAKKKPKK